VRWLHSAPKPCFCTSPKGYWCTRTDRHTVHEAVGGTGRVYSRWKGDYPDEQVLVNLFSSAEQFWSALSPGAGDELSAADHNDLVWGVRGIDS
jgi:hypothetical protein